MLRRRTRFPNLAFPNRETLDPSQAPRGVAKRDRGKKRKPRTADGIDKRRSSARRVMSRLPLAPGLPGPQRRRGQQQLHQQASRRPRRLRALLALPVEPAHQLCAQHAAQQADPDAPAAPHCTTPRSRFLLPACVAASTSSATLLLTGEAQAVAALVRHQRVHHAPQVPGAHHAHHHLGATDRLGPLRRAPQKDEAARARSSPAARHVPPAAPPVQCLARPRLEQGRKPPSGRGGALGSLWRPN